MFEIEKDEYKATKTEVVAMLNELTDQVSVNEVMKFVLCEWICEKVSLIDESCEDDNKRVADQAIESLQTIFAKFNGAICQVDDVYTILISPQKLSDECDLKQLREIKDFINTELQRIAGKF